MSCIDKGFYVIVTVGPNVWRAFTKGKKPIPLSPIYSDPAAAEYYVERDLKEQIDKEAEKLLGKSK